MTRICFVGNSHLASIKLGWDAVSSEYPNLEASFFGAPAAGLSHMVPEDGGYLVSNSSGITEKLQALWGTDRFRPADYDVLCLIGMGLTTRVLVRLYASYRSSLHRNRKGKFRLLSPECFQAAANGSIAGQLGAKVLARIREVSRRPMVIAAQAAPARPCWQEDAQPPMHISMLKSGDDRMVFDAFVEAVRQLPGADFVVPQPEITMFNMLATRPEYGEGSQRLDPSFPEHQSDETQHMNAAYGVLVLRDVFELLRRQGLVRRRAAQAVAPALELSA